MKSKIIPALAFVAAGITASGVALTSVPATAATTRHVASSLHAPPKQPGDISKPLSRSKLAEVRDRQHRMVTDRTTPTFKAGAKTFTVNTTEDSALDTPALTTCKDLATGRCSLRAAVGAANNLNVPVRILLGKHTYTLGLALSLSVTNPKGVSIVGHGAGKTAVAGSGSGLFDVTATGSGRPSGELFLSSLRLRNGTAAYGGAVYLNDYSGSTLVLDHVVASNNTASSEGGAIFADDYNGIFISDSAFTHNHSPSGGALAVYWSDVEITGTSFTDNSSVAGSYGYGGAIYNDYGVLDITGGSFSGNTVGDDTYSGYGGAIYDTYGQTTLTKVHTDANTAIDGGEGGAVYANEDILQVNHGSMSHNHADGTSGSGGALFSNLGAQQGLHGVTMVGNRAGGNSDGYGGGTVYVYGYEYPVQLVIDSGTKITGSDHSAVYLYAYEGGIDATITGSTLAHNTDTSPNGMNNEGCGGAVCAFSYYYGAVNLEMQGDHVTGNTSSVDYGTGGVEVYSYEYSPASVVLRQNVFSKNESGAYGYGGAFGVYSDDEYSPISARMASNTFTSNSAGTQSGAGDGGAVFAYDYVTVSDKGSTFSKNRADGDGAEGGAVGDFSYDASSFTGSTFTGNSAGTNHAGNTGYGGAYYSTDYQGGSAFSKVTMSHNKAASQGGGYYGNLDNYQASFTGSTISGNTAGTSSHAGNGGGIYVTTNILVLQNSTLTGNRATSIPGTPGQGGAIWHAGQRLGLRYSTVSGNIAKEGAGIYSNAYGGSILSSIVSRNRTSASGSEKDCSVAGVVSRLNSLGGNVLGQGGCVTGLQKSDKVSRKLHLGKLKNNGGPTKTMAISKKSPAVGRATYQVPSTDQRGHNRPGNHADAGAFELPKVKKHHHH